MSTVLSGVELKQAVEGLAGWSARGNVIERVFEFLGLRDGERRQGQTGRLHQRRVGASRDASQSAMRRLPAGVVWTQS